MPSISIDNYALIPLATWLFLITLIPIYITCRNKPSMQLSCRNMFKRRTWWSHYLCSALIIANMALSILEIARLHVSQRSIGVLPATPIGLAIALLWHSVVTVPSFATNNATKTHRYSWPSLRNRLPLIVYWLFLFIFEAVKVQNIQQLPSSENDSRYPNSDMLIDNACILGVSVVLLLLEFVPGQGQSKN